MKVALTAAQRNLATGILIIAVSISLIGIGFRYAGKERPESMYKEEPAPSAITAQAEAPSSQQLSSQENKIAAIRVHTVKDGEALTGIADQYHIDVATLYAANPELSEEIKPGDSVVILPGNGVLHTVREGDTIWGIGKLYHVDDNEILRVNGKITEDILVGEKLFIPGGRIVRTRAEAPVSRAGVSRFLWPVKGEVTSGFGYRWGRLHSGIDIANDTGTAIRAALAGKVSYAGWCSGYGYTVMLDHDHGYMTLYGHLEDYIVASGDYVKAGQVIAYMGNTGNSTGPHLHFEIQKDGIPVNPKTLLP